ncbi:MAG TPA: DnaJ domain-containing protein [Alphaproteobacteria bacterium]|nr:DnaJ domain-containing protein [Alphaproteobacteria bacterium]
MKEFFKTHKLLLSISALYFGLLFLGEYLNWHFLLRLFNLIWIPCGLSLYSYIARLKAKPCEKCLQREALDKETSKGLYLSRAEALQILGLANNATTRDIRKAYVTLMRKIHPDQEGGSLYLAKLLNRAKERLLAHIEG